MDHRYVKIDYISPTRLYRQHKSRKGKAQVLTPSCTPHNMFEISEKELSEFVKNFRFGRYDWNRLTLSSEKPITFTFRNIMSRLIVSNAF